MTTLSAIRSALQTKLADAVDTLPVVWENTAYQPVAGQPYAAAYLLPARPDNPVIGNFFVDRGVFQVSLFYPAGPGTAAATAMAETIRAAFAYGTALVHGSTTVTITATPEIAPGRAEDDLFFLPVRMRWSAQNGG